MAAAVKTTHTGSLPRPAALLELLQAKERDESVDQAKLEASISKAVDDIVARQVRTGISVVNDGEMSKMTYATYARHRISGIEPGPRRPRRDPGESYRFRTWWEAQMKNADALPVDYQISGPLKVKDTKPLEDDLRHLRDAATKAGATELFMNAASPGILMGYIPNVYYKSPEECFSALVEVLRPEYEAIVAAGFTLQLDCPDLGASGTDPAKTKERDALKNLAVEAINAATANIDPKRMRLHLCWGNGQAPHTEDLPLSEVIAFALKARPGAISFEGGNPRHEHEWTYFESSKFPDDKIIIPGIIDNTTAFVEHPEIVAQRITHYTRFLGNERVMGGVDCGFATWASHPTDLELTFAKLESLVAGAEIASKRS